MARPAFNWLTHGAAVALFAVAYGACLSGTGNANSGSGGSSASGGGNSAAGASAAGGGTAGGTTAPIKYRWWNSCPLFGCPDIPPKTLPCSADQAQGQPCDFPGAVCDDRLPCGAIVLCAPNDPKGNGCP
jgi:hypothetical protein